MRLFNCMVMMTAFTCIAGSIGATNVYVVPPDTPGVTPDGLYQSWATAATNIQDAIVAINTNNGNVIYITNGVYLLPDQITVNKGVTLRSYKSGNTAPQETILDGNNYDGKPVTNLVVYMNHAEATLDGFTVRGGKAPRGAGIYVFKSLLITNCIVINNEATIGGGGIYSIASGSLGAITHTIIASNIAVQGGGCAIYGDPGNHGVIEHCEIVWNEATDNTAANGGGGIRASNLGTNIVIRNCLIAHNTVMGNGGGINLFYSGLMENCVIVSNNQTSGSSNRDGSALYLYSPEEVTLRGCLIAHNISARVDSVAVRQTNAAAYRTATLKLENCTIVENNPRGLTVENCLVYNTLIYGNQTADVRFLNEDEEDTVFCNSLSSIDLPGTDNLNATPIFADAEFRLALNSPGVNAGQNLPWMSEPGAVDLGGNRRVDYMHNQVDIGCYEYLFRGVMFKFR